MQAVAAKYKLDRFLRYGHQLTGAEWNEKTSQWTLKFDIIDASGAKVGEETKVADVVIQGLGGLSRWDWPSIKGLEVFKVCSRSALIQSDNLPSLHCRAPRFTLRITRERPKIRLASVLPLSDL